MLADGAPEADSDAAVLAEAADLLVAVLHTTRRQAVGLARLIRRLLRVIG